MAIVRQKIVADLETTTDPNDPRVWAVCAVDINTSETVHLSTSLDDFFEWLRDKNTTCFFHNLKFDGCWLLPWLINHGFRQDHSHEPNTFETLISDAGVFYSITVYFEKLKNKQYKKVVFLDSLKKLPFSVKQIAKSFDLVDHKLRIDYDAPRPPGYQLTEHEKAYVVNDCRIVAQALNIQFEKELEKMTVASDAMNWYKGILGGTEYFRKWFPELPLELDIDLRRAYKGGWTYLQPNRRMRRGMKGKVYDINSLYPWVMRTKLLPYGNPFPFEGEPVHDPDLPLFIVRLRCEFEIKPDHLPTIQLKKNRWFIENEYLTSSDGKIVEMTLTNVDLELFLDHYNVYNLEYEQGWKFKAKRGFFDEYIDYWMEIKKTTTAPALRQLAKLMLNSLYGKFGLNPISGKNRKGVYVSRNKEPWLDEDGILQFELMDEDPRVPVYIPMGAFITAYAREKTIRAAQSVYDRFIYADTDSLHLEGEEPPEGLEIDPKELGAWKDEGTFTNSKYIRAKTYMETIVTTKDDTLENYARLMPRSEWIRRENGKIIAGVIKVTCAGMPDAVKDLVTYDNFKVGEKFFGKLVPKYVPGGVVLEPTWFTIRG